MAAILCIDKDRYLCEMLAYALVREGFEPVFAHTGRDALGWLRAHQPVLVLLDPLLPDKGGLRVLSTLRTFSHVPVIVLCEEASEEAVIGAFELGADDYVAKPFNIEALMSRIRRIVQRTAMSSPWAKAQGQNITYALAGAIFDPVRQTVISPLHDIYLTHRESQILHLLITHQGQTLSTWQIQHAVGTWTSPGNDASIRTHIHHLRDKLRVLPDGGHVIQTLPRRGYRIDAAVRFADPAPLVDARDATA